MYHKPFRITEIVDECKNVKTFLFDEDVREAIPGQFVMGWIPGKTERPLSISNREPLGLTVKKFDLPTSVFTPAMFELKEGDKLWIRGPIGNGFPVDEMNNSNLYNVGGGTGNVPLKLLAESVDSKIISFIGAKTSDELLFEDRFRNVGEVHIATEDGSRGEKGFVTDLLNNYEFAEDGRAAICGPEKMIYRAAGILGKKLEHNKIYGSFERLMKCAYGLCGSCALGHYRVCADGPVFTAEEMKGIPDFGKFKRDRCGRKEPL
jgi:dihydroorotate dehydrogenase electron transfer subunit